MSVFSPDPGFAEDLLALSRNASTDRIDKALARSTARMEDFAVLISPNSTINQKKRLAAKCYDITRKRFGFALSLYIPLYYDNRCTNGCVYCGFNVNNDIPRTSLSREEIRTEARKIRTYGFKNILLVAGEHRASADVDRLVPVIQDLHEIGFTCVSIEIAPLDEADYRSLVDEAHLDGLYVYQETYDRNVYDSVHRSGRKKNYDYRLETPERGARAGIPKIGIGALLGLHNWRLDMLLLAQHLKYLQKYHWQAEYSISFPRIREAWSGQDDFASVSDTDFMVLSSALRLLFPETGMSLTTRETPAFRDRITPFGFTTLSAGSSTSPGGYAGDTTDLEQFSIADTRSPREIAVVLKQKGFDPVWKDWE